VAGRSADEHPVKVAHVIGSLLVPLGGAEQYVFELSRGQAAAGHDVTVIAGWASPGVVTALAADGVTVELVRSRRPYPPDRRGSRPAALLFHGLDLLDSLRAPRPLRRALAQDFDAVHAHRIAGIGAGFLRSASAPVVTVHDYSLVDTRSNLLRGGVVAARPPLLQRLRTRVMSSALARATMIFPGEQLRERHRAWGLEIPEGSVVVPHGWRVDRRATTARRRTGPVVFLFLGKLLPTKGVQLLLEAWGDGISGAELWIAGTGVLEPEVASAADSGRVRFLGWLDDAGREAALAAASVMVLPSTGPEIFLLAAAEGALAGLPVISTTIAAPPAVRDGESGILVAPSAAALRSGMERLMQPDERARLAVGASAFAADLDFDRHLDRVLAVYAAAGAREPETVR
jgi:glycosyltransferase involved in cell wall biosynthesis